MPWRSWSPGSIQLLLGPDFHVARRSGSHAKLGRHCSSEQVAWWLTCFQHPARLDEEAKVSLDDRSVRGVSSPREPARGNGAATQATAGHRRRAALFWIHYINWTAAVLVLLALTSALWRLDADGGQDLAGARPLWLLAGWATRITRTCCSAPRCVIRGPEFPPSWCGRLASAAAHCAVYNGGAGGAL